VLYAPRGTKSKNDYRVRNEYLVSFVEHLHAFWTGKTRHSGTYMTINIAKNAGISVTVDRV